MEIDLLQYTDTSFLMFSELKLYIYLGRDAKYSFKNQKSVHKLRRLETEKATQDLN